MNNNSKGFVHLILIIGVVLVGIIILVVMMLPNDKRDSIPDFLYKMYGPQIVEKSSQPTTKSIPTSIQDEIDTSSWETYRNEEALLTFQYPSSWETTEGEYLVIQASDNVKHQEYSYSNRFEVSNGIHFIYLEGNLEKDAKSMLKFMLDYNVSISDHSPKLLKETDELIANNQAKRFEIVLQKPIDNLPYTKVVLIYFYKQGILWEVQLLGNNSKELNQILSTFQFTN